MNRRCSVAVALFIGLVTFINGEDDPITKKLQAAKSIYEKEIEKIEKSVLEVFDKREEDARKNGNKKLVDQIKAERESYLEVKEGSMFMPSHLKQRYLSARLTLETAYKNAIKEYTKAKKDDEAANMEKELAEFKKGFLPVVEWWVRFPIGKYECSYSIDVKATTELKKEGSFHRIRTGNVETNGKIEFKNGSLILQGDDFVEVWTMVGGKIRLQHWSPVDTFPKKKPQAIGEAVRKGE